MKEITNTIAEPRAAYPRVNDAASHMYEDKTKLIGYLKL